MGTAPVRFEVFLFTDASRIVLLRCRNVMVWLEVYVPSSRRGRGVAARLIRYLVSHIAGRHQLHFPPEIRPFSRLAKVMPWKAKGESVWFAGCVAYEYLCRQELPLRSRRLSRFETNVLPELHCFWSRREAEKCVRLISADLGCSSW